MKNKKRLTRNQKIKMNPEGSGNSKYAMKCPRCLKNELDKDETMNSLSRMDNATYICEECGQEEATLNAGVLFLTDEIIERDSRITPA